MTKLKKTECPKCGSNNIEELGKYLCKCKDCGLQYGTNVWDD